MECRLDLSEVEWEIVLELLKRERGDLHAEIRHTDSRDYRHGLHDRLKTIEEMVTRLEKQPVA